MAVIFDAEMERPEEFDAEFGGTFQRVTIPGKDGGHYTPVFEQVDEEHVRVSFVPSDETLPEVEETILELPQGPKGDDYILTDADKTEIAEEAAELIEVGEFRETDPTVPSWAKQPQKPSYNASEVGALPSTTKIPSKPEDVGAEASGTAEAKVSEHNTESKAHNDIRLLIAALEARVNGIFDSEDVDLDQVSEIVAFIKSNRSLIEKVTTDKVNVTDIIDDLTTSAANKPLSAKQGVQLKSLIDGLATAFNNHGADTVSHVTSEEKQAWNNKSDFSGAYKDLTGQPDIPSKPEDIGAQPAGNYLTEETDPTVPNWAKQPTKPSYTASEVGALPSTTKIPSTPAEVGADPAGTAGNAVSAHNTNAEAHNDLRLQVQALADRLNAFFDSDDTTLDELSEIVAYIKSNKTLIDAITTNKVNVTDIIDNLTTNVANKPLSAAQGVALKALIDALGASKLDASKLTEAVNTALAQAKASGDFDGKDGEDYVLTDADKQEIVDQAVDVLSGEITDLKDGLTLGIASDGLIYLFKNGSPTGTGIPQGQSGDVFGYVDENNTIVLTGTLADGTYSLKYEKEDGSTIDVGSLVISDGPSAPTNILTSGKYTISLNKRFSKSVNGLDTCNGMITFTIPLEDVLNKTIRMKGFTSGLAASGKVATWYIYAGETSAGACYSNPDSGIIWNCIGLSTDENGVSSVTVDTNSFAMYSGADRLHINLAVSESAAIVESDLADKIITIDEPID